MPFSSVSGHVAAGKYAHSGNTSFKIGELRVVIKQGDITEEDTDAIVSGSKGMLNLSRGACSLIYVNRYCK